MKEIKEGTIGVVWMKQYRTPEMGIHRYVGGHWHQVSEVNWKPQTPTSPSGYARKQLNHFSQGTNMSSTETTKRDGLLNPDFKYTNSAETDILKTYARFGWEPPSHARNKRNREQVRETNRVMPSGKQSERKAAGKV